MSYTCQACGKDGLLCVCAELPMLDVVEMENLAQACFAKDRGDGGYGLVGEHIESLCEDLKVDRPTKQDAHDTIVAELTTIIVAAKGLLAAIDRR